MMLQEWFQPRPGPVAISLIDASGRQVGSWRTEASPSGWSSWRWNGGSTERPQSGIYWIRLTAGEERWTTRAVLLP